MTISGSSQRNSSSSSMTRVLAFSSTSSPLRAKSYARLPFTLQAEKTGGPRSHRAYETNQRFLHHLTRDMFRGILRIHGLLQVERRRGSPQTERGHILFRMGLKFLYPLRRLTGADEQYTGGQKDRAYRHVPLSVSSLPISCTTGNVPCHQPERRPLVWLVKSQYFSFLEIHLSEF